MGPICLPKQTEAIEYSQKNATVAGWGRPLAKSGAGNRILQKLDIPLFYNRKCKRLMNDLTSRMICGGYLEGGKDACVSFAQENLIRVNLTLILFPGWRLWRTFDFPF